MPGQGAQQELSDAVVSDVRQRLRNMAVSAGGSIGGSAETLDRRVRRILGRAGVRFRGDAGHVKVSRDVLDGIPYLSVSVGTVTISVETRAVQKRMPARVTRAEDFWTGGPPEPSERLTAWLRRIGRGWRVSRHAASNGYHAAAEYYGVWIHEYCAVLGPATWGDRGKVN